MTVDGSGLADAFNDLTPLVFKTADFGKTWTRIVEGIDATSNRPIVGTCLATRIDIT